MKKLKSCPFCGSAGELNKCVMFTNDGEPYRYKCSNNDCEVRPSTNWYPTKKGARKVWDRRVK